MSSSPPKINCMFNAMQWEKERDGKKLKYERRQLNPDICARPNWITNTACVYLIGVNLMDLSIVEMCVDDFFSFHLIFVLLVWFLLNAQIADYLRIDFSMPLNHHHSSVHQHWIMSNNHIPLQPPLLFAGFCNPIIVSLFILVFFSQFVSASDSFSGDFIWSWNQKKQMKIAHCHGIVSIELS